MDNFDSGLKIVKQCIILMEEAAKKEKNDTKSCVVCPIKQERNESLDAVYAFLKDLKDMFEKFGNSKQEFIEYLRNDTSKEMFTRRLVELKFKIIFNLGLKK